MAEQVFAFSDQDFELMKAAFADNDEPLMLIRKALLQFDLTLDQKKQLQAIVTPGVWKVVKKRIHPDLDQDAPLSQIGDIYQTLSNDLRTKGVMEMAPLFEAKQIEKDYLDQQFAYLADPTSNMLFTITLDGLKELKGKTDTQRYVDTTARNFLLNHIDMTLGFIKIMAGTKKETIEETKKRLMRDSNK